ncbi:MAG TPA: PPOX class F420-dependent oxidoreductase [Gaiellaceae bacterium]|nr:PPOX class F420-dependent oxidoreductase [Gaiellaceae bacterium]
MARLTDEHIELLKGKNFAIVGTVGRDGVPQLTTNWIDWDGERVVFNTAEGRVKPRNIRRNPIVSVCVLNHENPYQYLAVVGPAEISDEGAEEHINELSHRYFGRDYHYVPGEKRLIVRIKPERVFARGF